jgi:hypothetical protein
MSFSLPVLLKSGLLDFDLIYPSVPIACFSRLDAGPAGAVYTPLASESRSPASGGKSAKNHLPRFAFPRHVNERTSGFVIRAGSDSIGPTAD